MTERRERANAARDCRLSPTDPRTLGASFGAELGMKPDEHQGEAKIFLDPPLVEEAIDGVPALELRKNKRVR
jgi:hypothetical protein